MFEKDCITKEVWMIDIAGKRIPLEAITAIIKAVAISVFIVLAYNMGVANTQELYKWFAYTKGDIQDPATGATIRCDPVLEGNHITWACENSMVKNFTVKNIS